LGEVRPVFHANYPKVKEKHCIWPGEFITKELKGFGFKIVGKLQFYQANLASHLI
jgi:hypothetical protein